MLSPDHHAGASDGGAITEPETLCASRHRVTRVGGLAATRRGWCCLFRIHVHSLHASRSLQFGWQAAPLPDKTRGITT